ncbi:MAG TPA: hypothetical protein PLW61_05355 [Caldisericia bacterium]|jgi:hypothetical protein|nr:hypothetical protein [Caldisericia bacterium]HRT03744.1 hypothetical protein [Candidatus Diapherotrites archaeon]HON83499.1 hypothetical protein [Caldisericia bacterium]HPB34169.1 hypothetical protein [Caldisericia bacterium]HQL67421.1 hypothetical protein [Caldisericia bacterium]
MRRFIEFYDGDDESYLEVSCETLNDGENEELFKLLKEKEFKFESIDSDSLRAVKRGKYEEILKVIEELKQNDFKW